MKTLKMMLLLPAIALMIAANAQEVQTEKKTFTAKNNIRFAGMELMPDGTIYLATTLQGMDPEHEGTVIYKMYPNGALISKLDVKLDHLANFAVAPDGGYLILFDYGMFEDATSVTMDFQNRQEYYYSEREPKSMPGVLKLSSYGSLEWIRDLQFAQYFNDMDESRIIIAPDGKYLVLFNYSEEDPESEYGAMIDYTRFVVLDKSGNILTEKTYNENDYGKLLAPVLQPDGKLMVFSDGGNQVPTGICLIDQQGNITGKKHIHELDSLWGTDVYSAGEHGFVVNIRESSGQSLWLIDPDGKISWKKTVPGVIWSVAPTNDGIMSISAEKMVFPDGKGSPERYMVTRYSKDGEVIPAVNFTCNGAIWIKDIIATDYNGVLAAGNTKAGESDDVSLVITIPSENSDIFRNINSYDFKEYTRAVETNNADRIRALAAFGISPNYKWGNKTDDPEKIDYPLLMAIYENKYDIAWLLLDHGAEVNNTETIRFHYVLIDDLALEHLNVTPLMYIAVNNNFNDAPKFVELLAKYKANFEAFTGDGSVFALALGAENTAFMDIFIKYQELSNSDKEMHMKKAIEDNRPHSLKWLLDHGANPYNRDFLGNVIYDYGMQMGGKEVKAVLKDYAKTHKQ